MKKLLLALGVSILCIIGVFAYTPSPDLQEKMDVVLDKLEDVIDIKGESYRLSLLSVIDEYMDRYEDNERATYILSYIYDNLKLDNTVVSTGKYSFVDDSYMGSYNISDSEYGTEVDVVVSDDTRTMTSNALPNHETGDFPNSGNPNTISAQNKSYSLDVSPEYTGDATWTRESGVAYNGIKFELETNERVECTSGETYKIEAIQDMTDLGLDHNHAHVQPTGEYHYHGAAEDLIDTLEGDDIVHLGFANDGFPILYSKNSTYDPSYGFVTGTREGTSCTYRGKSVDIDNTIPDGTYVSDWVYDGSGDLDECNGTTIDGEYVYFMTDEYPYGPRCLNGDSATGGSGPQGGSHHGDHMGPPPRR